MTAPHDLDACAAWERDAWEVCAAPYAASLGELTRGASYGAATGPVVLPAQVVTGSGSRR